MHVLRVLLVPADKRARQYDLPPQQPWQPIPHLQPPLHPPALPASSSSPAALPPPDITSSPMQPIDKKQQQDDDVEHMMDSLHRLEPHDPPLLPLADKQPTAALDLEASRSEHHDPQRQLGQEGSSAQGEQLCRSSCSSLVAPTEFCSDIAQALGRAQAQVGDPQDFDFWNQMRQHNLVPWLGFVEEATSYHTLDVSMWGAVKYRRTFSADSCNMVQTVHQLRFIWTKVSSPNSGMILKPLNLLIGFVIVVPMSLRRSALSCCPTWINGHLMLLAKTGKKRSYSEGTEDLRQALC